MISKQNICFTFKGLIITRKALDFHTVMGTSLIYFQFILQYSTKEDKYEEEIRVLTDKLKEVSFTGSLE